MKGLVDSETEFFFNREKSKHYRKEAQAGVIHRFL